MIEAASSYPLLNAFWTMLVFFAWVIWFWMLIVIFSDLFRRHDVSGWGKAGWFILILFLPYLGVLIYLIAQGKHMAERRQQDAIDSKKQFDEYVRQVSTTSSNGGGGSATDEIQKGKQLLDSGAITADEFEALKRKALAA
jgi:phospholipase D-like protein/putative oligomerization/nucleic acid binding protein